MAWYNEQDARRYQAPQSHHYQPTQNQQYYVLNQHFYRPDHQFYTPYQLQPQLTQRPPSYIGPPGPQLQFAQTPLMPPYAGHTYTPGFSYPQEPYMPPNLISSNPPIRYNDPQLQIALNEVARLKEENEKEEMALVLNEKYRELVAENIKKREDTRAASKSDLEIQRAKFEADTLAENYEREKDEEERQNLMERMKRAAKSKVLEEIAEQKEREKAQRYEEEYLPRQAWLASEEKRKKEEAMAAAEAIKKATEKAVHERLAKLDKELAILNAQFDKMNKDEENDRVSVEAAAKKYEFEQRLENERMEAVHKALEEDEKARKSAEQLVAVEAAKVERKARRLKKKAELEACAINNKRKFLENQEKLEKLNAMAMKAAEEN